MLGLSLFCALVFFLQGLGVTLGYHRLLTHRALKLPRWLEYFFVTMALPAGTPIQWVGNHRYHHANSDQEGDPHSPLLGGFWHAHVGWYIGTSNPIICFFYSLGGPIRQLYDGWNRPRSNREYDSYAADIAKDRYYSWLGKPIPYQTLVWAHVALFYGTASWIWGLPGLIAVWVTTVIGYNAGDGVDSIAHLFGENPFRDSHHARNNPIIGVLALGEGWHANHHSFPSNARHGIFSGQFDLTWIVICLLERIGLATDVIRIDGETIKRRLASNTAV